MKSGKLDIYYVVTLLFVLVSANANFLSSSDVCWFGIIVFTFLVAVFKKAIQLNDLRSIGIFSAIFLLFVAIRDPFVNDLDTTHLLSDVVFLFKFVVFVYLYCIVLKDQAAAYLVKVITHLTILSFVFFAFQLISSGELIYKFSTSLGLPSENQIPGYTNFLLFTFVKDFHDYSNSGFAWEPAAFGSFLILGLVLNFFLNDFKFDRVANILIAGIITTFGTTDYLALLIVLFMVYRYRVPKINAWAVLIILLFAGAIFTIPILGSKISDTYYEDMDDLNRLKFLATYYKHNNMQIPLNRFSSMVYIYQNFDYKLIWGISNKYDVLINKKYSINISNGIADFMARYGIIGLVVLLYKYGRFCKEYVQRYELVIYCILAFLTLGFGEPILMLPAFMVFLFIPLEQKEEEKSRRSKKSKELEEFDAKYSSRRFANSNAK